MSSMPTDEFESKFNKETKTCLVFCVLRDQQWHCRECEYMHTKITQTAGGSGIQGLQRGSSQRDGMEIESANLLCTKCDKTTRHDKWNGQFKTSVAPKSMPKEFQKRVLRILDSKDIVENTERTASHITIDHKLPMIRWDEQINQEQTDYKNMTDEDIRDNFQLLKKSNGSVSHNLLKSRSCEKCWKTGMRGTPFGIRFSYEGNARWSPVEKRDPKGCIGCGWYDFDLWRKRLNERIQTLEINVNSSE